MRGRSRGSLEPHVGQVVVVSPSDTTIRQARAKTDRLDARVNHATWFVNGVRSGLARTL